MFVSGITGQLLALVLISLGLVLATSLAFFEVGLSEDRALARSRARERARRRAAGAEHATNAAGQDARAAPPLQMNARVRFPIIL